MDRRTKLLSVLAAAGWGLFFASLMLRGDGAGPLAQVEVGEAGGVDDALSGAPPARTIAAPAQTDGGESRETISSSASKPKWKPKTHEELLAIILGKLESGESSPCFEMQSLGQLKTDEAKEQLLEWFADPAFLSGSRRGDCFANALAPFEDPRIGELAERYLRQSIEDGLEREAGGYLELLVTKNGRAGAEVLLEVLGTPKSNLTHAAVRLIAKVEAPELIDDFLSVAAKNPMWGDSIFDALAAWEDAAAHEALLQFAKSFDPEGVSRGTELLEGAMRAYGRGLTEIELDQQIGAYWTAASVQRRRSQIACLDGAVRDSSIDPDVIRDRYLAVVRDAFSSGEPSLVQSAAYLIEYNEPLWTDEYLSFFEQRANDSAVPEDERQDLRSLLIKLRRDR